MTTQTPIPRTQFSTAGLSAEDAWHAWREAFSLLFDIRQGGKTNAFRANIEAFNLQKMMLTRLTFGGIRQQGERSSALVRNSGLDHIGIEFCLHNDGYRCEGRHGTKEVRAGEIVVLDLAQECAMSTENSDSITLTVPRSVIEPHCPGIERLHGRRMGGPGPARLLSDHLLSLQQNLPHMTADQSGAVAESTLALVGACLAPSAERRERAAHVIDHTMLDRARRYIAGRLDDPLLSAASLCTAIGTSRSNLYRLFQPVGGVTRYIKECRLRRIHSTLRDPGERRSISELAYTYGFASAAHCSRAFRELFGCAPREIRNRARTASVAEDSASPEQTVGAWLKNLHW